MVEVFVRLGKVAKAIIAGDLDLTVDEIIEQLEAQGYEAAPTTISSYRQEIFEVLRLCKKHGSIIVPAWREYSMALRAKYAPGSFTKNFAWAGTGFKRLHTVIRAGYDGSLSPVQRNKWRTDSGINDASLELIPINFFLHNKDGKMSVDELVFQAIQRPHTIDFDRLALFAFHLNQVGKPPGQAVRRPALWANEFVKEVLWRRGSWQALNARGISTARGGTWHAMSVKNVLDRPIAHNATQQGAR